MQDKQLKEEMKLDKISDLQFNNKTITKMFKDLTANNQKKTSLRRIQSLVLSMMIIKETIIALRKIKCIEMISNKKEEMRELKHHHKRHL